ncbi:inosine-5'-monophosphate dehydrogenase, partial [Massospora cicadina]
TFNLKMVGNFLDPKTALEILKREGRDGLSAEELMDPQISGGLTFNDFLILPGYIDFSSDKVDCEVNVSRNFRIKTPFCV